MKHVIALLLAFSGIYTLVPTAQAEGFGPAAGRGCCSHHQGVCGCEGGRAKCCDGSLSPSCGCD